MSTTKYSLLLDDSAVSAVERLRTTYGLRNKAEVYDLAIRVLTWSTEQSMNDFEFGRYRAERFEPLHLPYTLSPQAWKDGAPQPVGEPAIAR